MAPPPTLPADARRTEPPPNPLTRSREGDGAQLGTLLTTTQRLEQSAQTSAASLQELRSELVMVRGQLSQVSSAASMLELRGDLQSARGQLAQASLASLQELRGELQSLRGQMSTLQAKDTTMPTPLISAAARAPSRTATVAAVVAAITALGALAGAALVIVEQKQQLTSMAEVAATTRSISQTVTQLGETVAGLSPAGAPRAHGTGKSGPGSESGTKSSYPADSKPPVCPPASEGAAAGKPRVLLPNLVGLRLAEARAAVAPLQLQLLPTDKKLKEASKIGWQLPNPGAELEPDEAVTVSLKPPKQKKKKG